MLPVIYGDDVTKLHILLYTILLLIVSLLPFLTGMSGLIYLFVAVVMGVAFMAYAIRLKRATNNHLAMRTFAFSLIYLAAIFSALLLDHYYRIDL